MGSCDRTKSGRWRARYRDPTGKQRAKSFDRKADAQKFLALVESDVVQGTWHNPALDKIFYRDWVDEWWSTTVDLRPSTRTRDETYLRIHVLPYFGEVALGELSPRLIRQWVAGLVEKGLAPATARKAYQLLSKSLRQAVEAGLLVQTPCRGVSLPKIEVKEMPVLGPSQILHLADTIDQRYRALILLAAYSGMRWGELVGLNRTRIDLEAKMVEVREIVVELSGRLLPPSLPKTKAGRRRIPIPPAVAEEIQIHLSRFAPSSDLVFQAPEGGPLRKSFATRFWLPATTKAGVCPFRFHDLRHTAISYWIKCGASPKQIAKWAGHTSTSVVLDRYGHLFPEADEKLISALDAMFRQAKSDRELSAKREEAEDSTFGHAEISGVPKVFSGDAVDLASLAMRRTIEDPPHWHVAHPRSILNSVCPGANSGNAADRRSG